MNNRIRALKIACLLGLLGPLPGYIVFAGRNFIVASDIKESLWLFVYFYAGALLLYGWYCFIIGLLGSWFIIRFTQNPAPKWAQPLAIVVIPMLAAVPVILIAGGVSGTFGHSAVISSAFWCVVFLSFRRRIFASV